MRRLRECIVRFGGLFNKRRKDRELKEEIESHLQMHIEDNVRLGMTPEEARRKSMIKLGGIESTKEAYRDQRGLPVLETLGQDIRYGARQLRKNPGFTTVAVLTLALGVGANTAIFSLINAVMLRPVPFPNPERLAWMEEFSKENSQWPWGAHFLDWQEHSQTLESIAAYDDDTMTLTGAGEPERIEVGKVSAGFFSLLGAQPLPPGRNFAPNEDKSGFEHVAILSQELWQHRYQSKPDIIGRNIVLDDVSYTVIGVMSGSFRFFKQFRVWVPLALNPQRELVGPVFSLQPTIARLKPGVTPRQAQAELDTLIQNYETQRPQKRPEIASARTRLVPLQDHFLGETQRALLVLLGAVALVLLIACANVANLLLARAVARRKELATRAALGATRLRLARQILTECLLLALFGGIAGTLIATSLTRILSSLNLADTVGEMARVSRLSVDPRVFGFALLISLAAGLLFGLLSISRLSRPNLNLSLREGAHGSRPFGRSLRGALLVSEVALAVVLLAGAGLLVRSLVKLLDVNPGYQPKSLLTAQLRLPPRYDTAQKRARFYAQVLQRVSSLPGVESVGLTSQLPLTRYNMGGTLRIMDRGDAEKKETAAPITAANSDYFRTMGIGLRSGRIFNESDALGAPGVVLLSETLARQLFPTDDPIGRRISVAGASTEWSTVIGVVDDIRHQGLDHGIEPAAYLSFGQLPRPMMALVLRGTVAPSNLAPFLRQSVNEVDPALPLFDVMTMDARLSNSIAGRRFNLLLLGSFASLALLVAGVGVYGVIAYFVSERTREVGIRMALGATRWDVVRLVLRQGMQMSGIGIGIGILVALGLTQVMTRLLFEIKPQDPITFASITLILLFVALIASWLPASRAARLEPMIALRTE